jgi:hypothetical protein
MHMHSLALGFVFGTGHFVVLGEIFTCIMTPSGGGTWAKRRLGPLWEGHQVLHLNLRVKVVIPVVAIATYMARGWGDIRKGVEEFEQEVGIGMSRAWQESHSARRNVRPACHAMDMECVWQY